MKKILPSILLSILICLGSGADEKAKTNTMIFVKGNAAVSSFYICDHEVTQAEYSAMMGENPSQYYGDNKPVETVTWYDVVEYCNRRSKKEGLTPCYKIDKSKEDPNNHNEYEQADAYALVDAISALANIPDLNGPTRAKMRNILRKYAK